MTSQGPYLFSQTMKFLCFGKWVLFLCKNLLVSGNTNFLSVTSLSDRINLSMSISWQPVNVWRLFLTDDHVIPRLILDLSPKEEFQERNNCFKMALKRTARWQNLINGHGKSDKKAYQNNLKTMLVSDSTINTCQSQLERLRDGRITLCSLACRF